MGVLQDDSIGSKTYSIIWGVEMLNHRSCASTYNLEREVIPVQKLLLLQFLPSGFEFLGYKKSNISK